MAVAKKDLYAGIGLALVTTLIWSGNYVIARGISKQLPPVSLAFYRWSTASITLAPFAIKKMLQQKALIAGHKTYLFFTALTGITIFNTLIYIAGHYTSAINLALIGTTSAPIFIVALAAIFLKERIGRYRIAGMVVCLTGILYLLSQGSFQELKRLHFGTGDIVVLLSAFSFAIYSVLVKKKPASLSPVVFLFVVFVTGVICLLPFYLFEVTHAPPVHWSAGITYIILYLGIGNSVIAYFCWNGSIRRLGASGTALFSNLMPVFATIEAVLFLNEKFLPVHIVSGVLVIAGLIIANIPQRSSVST